MALKMTDLVARIDTIEAKVNSLATRVTKLEAELQRHTETHTHPTGFWAKLKSKLRRP